MTRALSELSMAMKGAVISFEGGDGSGKGTQSRLLFEYLLSLGIPAKFESFPRYHTPTGKKVAAYLNGELGEYVAPHEASLLYSNDRLAFRKEMVEWMEQGGVWILDRYVDSNKGHQGGKLKTREERIAFFKENDDLEFGENNMPVPDATILFTLPPTLAQSYIDQKMARAYTSKKRDLHEADPDHLGNANDSFMLFAEVNADRVRHITTAESNNRTMRDVQVIHQEVIEAIQPIIQRLLRDRPAQAALDL